MLLEIKPDSFIIKLLVLFRSNFYSVKRNIEFELKQLLSRPDVGSGAFDGLEVKLEKPVFEAGNFGDILSLAVAEIDKVNVDLQEKQNFCKL